MIALNIKSFIKSFKKHFIKKSNDPLNCKQNIIFQSKLVNNFVNKLKLSLNQIKYISFPVTSFASQEKQIYALSENNLKYLNIFFQVLIIEIIKIESNFKKIFISNNYINHKEANYKDDTKCCYLNLKMPTLQKNSQITRSFKEIPDNNHNDTSYSDNNGNADKGDKRDKSDRSCSLIRGKLHNDKKTIKTKRGTIKENKNCENISKLKIISQELREFKSQISSLKISQLQKIYRTSNKRNIKVKPDICDTCPAIRQLSGADIEIKRHAKTIIRLLEEKKVEFGIQIFEKIFRILIEDNIQKHNRDFIDLILLLLKEINIKFKTDEEKRFTFSIQGQYNDFIEFMSLFVQEINIVNIQDLLMDIKEISAKSMQFTLYIY